MSYTIKNSILFYSRLCPSTAGSRPLRVLHLSLCFAILVHIAPCCPTMSSLQRRFGLSTDLKPSICHSLFLIVHLLSFIQAMCPAHFHFILVTYWTMSVTLVLCLHNNKLNIGFQFYLLKASEIFVVYLGCDVCIGVRTQSHVHAMYVTC